MIRDFLPADAPALLELTRQTAMFKPLEIQALQEVFDDYAGHQAEGHRCITAVDGDQLVGFTYFAPAAMTDRAWYLWWISVAKDWQSKGIGSQLLRQVEASIRDQNGRLLLIDTSSTPHYEPTRRFYLKHGYQVATVLKDFYADGDDLVVFSKRM
jgi:ribosomal protein S18 acetylase RimI-like enzyme